MIVGKLNPRNSILAAQFRVEMHAAGHGAQAKDCILPPFGVEGNEPVGETNPWLKCIPVKHLYACPYRHNILWLPKGMILGIGPMTRARMRGGAWRILLLFPRGSSSQHDLPLLGGK